MGGAGVALHPGIHAIGQLASVSSGDASGGVFANQIGYLPTNTKQATVRCNDASDDHFEIRSIEGDRVVFNGRLGGAVTDAASGDHVRIAEFSKLHATGTYRIEAAGFKSDVFSIAPHAYANALKVTMRGYYGQRCGTAVDLGGGYRHPWVFVATI